MNAPSARFPFPFFGAGEAAYFEWTELHVELMRAPSLDEQREIADRVPGPLRETIEIEDTHVMVASERFVHLGIAESYELGGDADDDGSDPGVEPDDDFDDDDYDFGSASATRQGRLFFAHDDQVRAFNRDIEGWLRFIHELCPVRAAYRAEDHDAGGTELSEWHHASVRDLGILLPWLEQIASADDSGDDGFRLQEYMARGILAMADAAGADLPAPLRDWLEPGRRELAAVLAGDAETLRQLLAATPSIPGEILERLSEGIDPEDLGQSRTLLAAADLLIDEEELPPELFGVLVAAAARLRHSAGDRPPALGDQATRVLDAARQAAEADSRFGDRLAAVAHRLATSRRFVAAIEVFELLIDLPDLTQPTYCNALWAIQSDNNGLPVDPDRARRFLAACVPHGPDNPAIFFNAACVHMELGEHDQVLESIEAAIAHGYDKLELMQRESLFAPIAGDPDFVAIFERARARG